VAMRSMSSSTFQVSPTGKGTSSSLSNSIPLLAMCRHLACV
jgi:hypothetical protein